MWLLPEMVSYCFTILFSTVNETDLLYYVLYVCKQLSLKTNDLPLILSGEMSSRLVYSEMLRQYLPATDHDAATGLPAVSSGLIPFIVLQISKPL